MVKYSIAMSVYNTLPLVRRAVEAAINTMGPEAELLLVYNHPPFPEVGEYLRGISHPQVRILDPGENLGCHRGNNYAFRQAQGQYLIKLDDDIIVPQTNWLADMAKATEEHNLAYVALPWIPETINDPKSGTFVQGNDYVLNFPRKAIIFGCVMIRRDLWFAKFIFNPSTLYGYEELYWRDRAKEMGLRPAYLVNHPVEHIGRSQEADTLYGAWKILYAKGYAHPHINDFAAFRESFVLDGEAMELLKNFGLSQVDLQQLWQATVQSRAGGVKILAIVPGIIPSVELGVVQPLNRLAAKGRITWKLVQEADVTAVDIARSDVLLFQRNHNKKVMPWLKLAKHLGKGVIYDLDDNFFALAYHDHFFRVFQSTETRLCVRELLKEADLVKVTSEFLKDISLKYNSNVELIHYSIDPTLIEQRPRRQRDPGQIVIGYAGTIHRDRDFHQVLPALRKIVREYGNRIVLEFVDYVPEELKGHAQVRTTDNIRNYQDYINHLWERNWDIALAPLELNDFNSAKSPVKFRDYGVCRVAGVYTDCAAYRPYVTNMETGILVEPNPDQWYEALKTLIENEALRVRMGDMAYQVVLEKFGAQQVDSEWERILTGFVPTMPVSPGALQDALKAVFVKPTKVLGVTAGVSPTTEVSLIQSMSYLSLLGRVHWNLVSERKLTARKIRDHDVIIFQRTVNPRMQKFLNLARKLKKKVIYDIDDNFLAIKNIAPRSVYRRPRYRNSFIKFLKSAHVVRAGSYELAKVLSRYNRRVTTLPYSVDFTLVDGLNRRSKDQSDLIIGYAGTAKPKDFELVIPALLRILNEYPQVRLEFMGFVPPVLAHHPRVNYIPYNFDYRNFMRWWWQRNWDIGIAPLLNHSFNRAKTDIKYREYGAMGICGIYANIPAYRQCVQNGVNGWVINHLPEEWYQMMKTLLENPHLREQVSANAESNVRHAYTVEASAAGWERLLKQKPKKRVKRRTKVKLRSKQRKLQLKKSKLKSERKLQLTERKPNLEKKLQLKERNSKKRRQIIKKFRR